jgi:hypothetical protein
LLLIIMRQLKQRTNHQALLKILWTRSHLFKLCQKATYYYYKTSTAGSMPVLCAPGGLIDQSGPIEQGPPLSSLINDIFVRIVRKELASLRGCCPCVLLTFYRTNFVSEIIQQYNEMVDLQGEAAALQSGGEEHGGQAKTQACLDVVTSSDGDAGGVGGRNDLADGANRRLGGEGGSSGVGRAVGSSGGRTSSGGGSGGRHRDVGDGDLSGDGLGGAAARDGGATGDTRLSEGGLDHDSGVGNRDNGSSSDGEDVGDGINASDDSRVLANVAGAHALEESSSLGNDVVASTVRVDTLEGLLNEVGVGAEASNIQVVGALLNKVEPRVETLGNDIGARKRRVRSLGLDGGVARSVRSRGNRAGRGRAGRGGLGRLDWGVARSVRGNNGLGDRADSGGHWDSLSHNDGSAGSTTGRAVRDLRTARSDGLDGSGKDG